MKRALEVRVAAHLADDLGPQQRGERLVDALARDALEHVDREPAADRRGDLGEPARTVGLPVDAGDEEVLERRRKQLERAGGDRPGAAAGLERSFEERSRELHEVERVPLGFPDEAHPGRRSSSWETTSVSSSSASASVSGPTRENRRSVGIARDRVQPQGRPFRIGERFLRDDERHGGAVGELEDRLGELACLDVGPVSVLDGDDHRLPRGEGLQPADVGAVDRVGGRSDRRLEAQSQQRGQRSEDVVEPVAEQCSQTGPRLRPDRDLRLADLGTQPVEEDLDERPTRQASVRVAVAREARRRGPRRACRPPRAAVSCPSPGRRSARRRGHGRRRDRRRRRGVAGAPHPCRRRALSLRPTLVPSRAPGLTGSAGDSLPLTVTSPAGSRTKRSASRRAVPSPTRMVPGSAAACSRAATLVASPSATICGSAMPTRPTAAGPLLTPILTAKPEIPQACSISPA